VTNEGINMISIFIKAISIYFIISFIRSIWKGYKMVEEIKKKGNQNVKDFQQTDFSQGHKSSSDNVIEAEFRVINKK
jgi:hypothetical protein